MCAAAKWNKERVPSTLCTFNRFRDLEVPADYAQSPSSFRSGMTCSRRLAAYHDPAHFVTWAAIEHELCEGDLCFDDFSYGTVLRDTISRIQSHVNYEGPTNVSGHIACIEARDAGACPVEKLRAGLNRTRNYIFFDNLVVRMLGGCDAMNQPPGGVNTSHLDAALAVLKRFDFVIQLGTLLSRPAQELMDRVMGWHIGEGTARDVGHPSDFHVPLTPSDTVRLQAINKYDMALLAEFTTPYGKADPLQD